MKFIPVLLVAVFLGIDQLTKYWASNVLATQGDILFWPNIFHFTYVENRGAAFGMLQNQQWFFITMTVIVLIFIVWYWRQIPNNKWGTWMKFALILIISGAIGNLIDRVVLGYVVDFLYFVLIDFPVFNVADIAVVVGVGILMPILLFGDIEPKKVTSKKDTKNVETEGN